MKILKSKPIFTHYFKDNFSLYFTITFHKDSSYYVSYNLTTYKPAIHIWKAHSKTRRSRSHWNYINKI